MGKLIRILVIYSALMITFIGVNTTISTRTILDKLNKSTSQIEEYQKQLEKITSSQQQTGQVHDEMNKLKAEIASSSQVLGTTEEPKEATTTQVGFITINDKKWENVSIYESKSYSSKVVGRLEFGKPYLYSKKEDSWYQIAVPESGINGWVPSRFFKETSGSTP